MAKDHIDTESIKKALEDTAPTHVPWWQRPLVAAAIIGVCITSMAGVSNLALWQWGKDKSERLEQIESQAAENAKIAECRSAVAADDATAQANKQITSQRLTELAAAAVLANDPALPAEERAVWRTAVSTSNIRKVFLDDIQASAERFEQSTRRQAINDICATGAVPEPQIEPLPVDPIIQLPN